jgi:hypothetical protein
MRRIIVDANIAFRALASGRGDLRQWLDSPAGARFIAPRFLFVGFSNFYEPGVR